MGAYRCAKCGEGFCSHSVVPEEVDGELWCEDCYGDLLAEAENLTEKYTRRHSQTYENPDYVDFMRDRYG